MWTLTVLIVFILMLKTDSFNLKTTSKAMRHSKSTKLYERWATPVLDEGLERVESLKTVAVSALTGSIASAPLGFFDGIASGFNTDWFVHDVTTGWFLYALFGLVYRYAVRRDGNYQLKQGVVGAFAITKTITDMTFNCLSPQAFISFSAVSNIVVSYSYALYYNITSMYVSTIIFMLTYTLLM
jgi:hypothetical protein